MDNELKNEYIRRSNIINYHDKFGNYDFVMEIKKDGVHYNSLIKTLEYINAPGGIVQLLIDLLKNTFDPARRSIDNNKLVLLKSKISGNFGLYDTGRGDWYNHNGITYGPTYKSLPVSVIKDDKDRPYRVETFSTSSSADEKAFYCITPHFSGAPNTRAHILSKDGYEKLLSKMETLNVKGKEVKQIKDFNPETDVDIKEEGVE